MRSSVVKIVSVAGVLIVLCWVAAAFAAAAGPKAGENLRIWKSESGHQVEARLLGAEEGKVRLETREGRQIEVAVDRLSKDDQAYVAGALKRMERATRSPAPRSRSTGSRSAGKKASAGRDRSAAPGTPQEPRPREAANVIENGDFENGPKGWTLHSGASIVALNAGGCLKGSAGAYAIADSQPDSLPPLNLAQDAGQKVTLSFDVWGSPEAHPGISLSYLDRDGKSRSTNVVWKTSATAFNIRPEQEPKRYERVITLPADAAQVQQLRIFNVAQDGVIYFDNLAISPGDAKEKAAAKRAQVIAGFARQWEGVTFAGGEELLELANTCNYLVCEWARVLSLIHDLRRMSSYAPGQQDAETIAGLERRLFDYRDRLTALREFYIAEFSRNYGNTYSDASPHGFYTHGNGAGRQMEIKVMRTKSRKAPFVRFEKELAAIRDEASRLAQEIERGACRQLEFKPLPIARQVRPKRSFDQNGNPTHIIWGLCNDLYRLFAFQWTGAEVQVMLDFRPDYLRMTPSESFLTLVEESLRPFGAKGFLRPGFPSLFVWMEPEFLRAAEANPEDCFESTEDGICLPARLTEHLVRYQFQCLNEKVMTALERQYTAISKIAKQYTDVIHNIMFTSEPVFWTIDTRKPIGYSPRFRKALQTRLAEKFGTIEKLNDSWKAGYASFAEIPLPTQAMMNELKPAHIPLIYEYRKFRKDYYATVYERIYRAIKKGSDLPVINGNARDHFNGLNNLEPFDTLRMTKAQDVDCHHHCAEGQTRHDALWVYHRSIARYLGKKSGSDEYYPTNPELVYFKWKSDPLVIFNRTMQNIGKDMAQGMAYINVWARLNYPGNDELQKGAFERRSGFTLMDEFWAAVPYLQNRLAAGAHDPLFSSQYRISGLAMLAPYDATLVCHPDGRIAVEGTKLHEFLTDRYWEYDCIPEELILSGEEPLTRFKVLIVPYTLWAQEKLQQKLLDWAAQGNTLIAIGPFGFWNEYGQESRKFLDQVFGKVPMTPAKGEQFYTFAISEPDIQSSGKGKVEYAEGGKCRIASAPCGKGRVWLTDASIETLGADARRILHKAIEKEMGAPAAACKFGRFYLYTREDNPKGNRYLIAVNKDVMNRSDDTIFAEGEFKQPVDLTVPGGFPFPVEHTGGFTSFSLSLAPGETAYINLGPYRASDQKPSAAVVEERYAKDRGPQQRKSMKQLTLSVVDKNGKAIPRIKIQVVGKNSRTGETAFDYGDLPVNNRGQAVFAVPLGEQYDLIVYDKEVNAEYSVTDVDPARQTEYKVTFSLFRADKR